MYMRVSRHIRNAFGANHSPNVRPIPLVNIVNRKVHELHLRRPIEPGIRVHGRAHEGLVRVYTAWHRIRVHVSTYAGRRLMVHVWHSIRLR